MPAPATATRFNPVGVNFSNFRPRHFQWQRDGKVATITLNRPERKNPLTLESYAELRDTFRGLVYCSDITNIVITGAGGNFCSGGDVHEIIGPLLEMQRDDDMAGLLAFTRSPVMRVNCSSSGMSILTSGPMISCTSPPEQKLPPEPVKTTALTSLA